MRRFYTSSPEKRLELVVERSYAQEETVNSLKEGLSLDLADQMIENAFGIYGLPYGLAFNFFVNKKEYVVPMATEEPSVIAAASGAAKTIKSAGGFKSHIHSRQMIGQVALIDIPHADQAIQIIENQEDVLIQAAHTSYPSIVKRGGGVRSLSVEYLPATETEQDFLVVYLSVDTQEAMGANILNTMLEGISPLLEEMTGGTALMGILSNYATNSLVTTRCSVPFDLLKYKKIEGEELAQKISAASQLAQSDVYRATTHNKGIMNGVDALVLATGNDWRAVEAGMHAYAARDGRYRGLSRWWIEDDCLVGEMTAPLAIGTVGGSIKLHPYAQASFEILNIESGQAEAANELAGLIAALGLAQNFAALRALVSEGIQKGHMALQAKSLAISVGAETDEVQAVVRQLKLAKSMNQATAQTILDQHRKNKKEEI